MRSYELNFAEHGRSLDVEEVEAVVQQLGGRMTVVRLVGCNTAEKARILSKVIASPVLGTKSKISIVSQQSLSRRGETISYTGFLTSAQKEDVIPYEVNFKGYTTPVKMYPIDASDVVMYCDGREVSHSDTFFTELA
ncbi:MAG: hypothetical protein H7A42_03915 [Chlamydiales bacterium]|nr:hypothetical protein [Chlamydiales bacterium]